MKKKLHHESEGSIIGSVIYSPGLYNKISWLEPENFHSTLNRDIWRAIKKCVHQGLEIDINTLTSINPNIRSTYLEVAIDYRIPDRNVEDFAIHLLNSYRLREMDSISRVITDGLKNGARANPKAFLAKIQDEMMRVNGSQAAESRTRSEDVIADAVEAVLRPPSHLTTPWPSLNRIASVRPSDVVVIAARPSKGKTSLACQWMIHLAKRGVPCAFFSLETSKSLLGKRILSIESGIQLNGSIPDEIKPITNQLKSQPFFVYDSIYDIGTMTSTMSMLNSTEGARVFFVDYLQLIEVHSKDDESLNFAIGKASRMFRKIANTLGVVVVLLSQLNRRVEDRASGRPKLSDLRDSGCIEQDASHVWLLWNPEGSKDVTQVLIAKQKDGPTGPVDLEFHKEVYRFEEVEIV